MSDTQYLQDVKKNEAFVLTFAPIHPTDQDAYPSVVFATNDVKIDKNGGGFAAVGTLPVQIGSTGIYELSLTATEMNTDRVTIKVEDVTATEAFSVQTFVIYTKAVDMDDLVRATTPANTLATDANNRVDVGSWLGQAVTVSGNNVPDVNVKEYNDQTAATGAVSNLPSVSMGAINDDATDAADLGLAIDNTNNLVKSDAVRISGGATEADRLEAALSNGSYIDANIVRINNATGGVADWQLFCDLLTAGVGTLPAAAIATDAITAAKIAADAIGSSELANTARDKIVDQVWDELQSGHVTSGSMGEMATELAAVLADTGTDGVQVDMAQTLSESPGDLTTGSALYILWAFFAHKVTTDSGTFKIFKADGATTYKSRTIDNDDSVTP